jgi:hypothetical protein
VLEAPDFALIIACVLAMRGCPPSYAGYFRLQVIHVALCGLVKIYFPVTSGWYYAAYWGTDLLILWQVYKIAWRRV